MFNLQNKSILLTGATGYLGRQIAVGLSKLGATVFVNSRSVIDCENLVSEITSLGYHAVNAAFDVTDEMEIKNFVDKGSDIDVLINNSYSGNSGNIMSSKTLDYMQSYSSAVIASANLMKFLEPQLVKAAGKSGDASIINIASMYGIVSPNLQIYPNPETANPPFYGAAKAGLIQLTKYAACEFAEKKIRVNCISPGPFPSSEVQTTNHKLVERIVEKVPMGRIGIPEELIGPVAFLASDASTFVTGVNIPVDGGWTAW